jgi:hypothetical protein
MGRLKKAIFAFALLITVSALAASCYRATNAALPAAPPAYRIFTFHGYVTDSVVNIQARLRDTAFKHTEWLSFRLISGNPTNYPFKIYLSGLPGTIKGTVENKDTFNCRLAISADMGLRITNPDTGTYTYHLNVYNDILGLKSYPIRLRILPK